MTIGKEWYQLTINMVRWKRNKNKKGERNYMQFLGDEFIFKYIYHFDSLVFHDKGRQVSLSIYVFDSFKIIREGIEVGLDHLNSLAPRARLLLVSNYLLYNFLF